MKKQLLLFIFAFTFQVSTVFSQNTVGLISYDPDQSYDGYNLIYPHNQPNVFLLDNCGEIVHIWTDSAQYRPGNTAYLLPNGNLVKTKRNAMVSNDPIWAGGGGAIIEVRSWENDLLWSYELNNENFRLHHDIAVTPDGTILAICWEKKTRQEAIQAGRDTMLLPDDEIWSEYIFEIDPASNLILWEWRLWDHLVQDFDPTKDNYGVVADHPERLDINFTTNDGERDWLHANAIDFNQELNQVLLCTPFLNEVYFIDHSTSTQQAAGSTGGLSGRGGDFMYRWGHPEAYDAGTVDDQTMFFPHDVKWIDDFVSPTHPLFGKLSFFNNRAGADFSTFEIFTPPWDMYKWRYTLDAPAWGPEESDIVLTHPEPTSVYSTGLSSLQVLDNGNYLICSGRQGYLFELNPDNELVWEYITPLQGGQLASQGDVLSINDNLTFRVDRYPSDYPAFDGKDLSPMGWIELNPNTDFCQSIINPVFTAFEEYLLAVYPNPADKMVTIEWKGGVYVNVDVVDLLGRQVIAPMRLTGGRKFLDTSGLQNGLYFVRINQQHARKLLIER